MSVVHQWMQADEAWSLPHQFWFQTCLALLLTIAVVDIKKQLNISTTMLASMLLTLC